MLNKLLVAICVLAFAVSAQSQEAAKPAAKKKVKKVVTTTTTETDENGKTTTKTEKSESVDEDTTPAAPVAAPFVDGGLPTINESWYISVGGGVSSASYSGSVGDSYKTFEDKSGTDGGLSVNIEAIGFYFPFANHKTMWGFTYQATASTLENDTTDEEFSITTGLLGFSVYHFFGQNIGDGFFLRGDAGISTASVEYDDGWLGTSDYDESDTSFGFLVGGGYGFKVGRETRVLVGLNVRPLPKHKFDNLNGSSGDLKGTVVNTSGIFLF